MLIRAARPRVVFSSAVRYFRAGHVIARSQTKRQRGRYMTSKLIKSGFALAALLAAPLAAHGADLPRPAYKAPAYVAPSYANWSGFYLGLNAGYGFGKSNWDIPAVSPDPKGALYGGTVGYNFQTGTWVWGIEGDFDLSSMKGSVDCGLATCETKDSWLATARARLGYAGWNNWLPYITGGAAMGNLKASNSAIDSAASRSSATRSAPASNTRSCRTGA